MYEAKTAKKIANASKFFSKLILMYLRTLMRSPNDAELHLVSIFVQIHFTPAKNALQMEFGIFRISYTTPLVE